MTIIESRNPIWLKFVVVFILSIFPFIFGMCKIDLILKLDKNSISITKKRILFCFNKTYVYNSGELKFFGIFYYYGIDEDEGITREFYTIKLVKTSGEKSTLFLFHGDKNMNLNGYKDYIDILNEHIKNNMT